MGGVMIPGAAEEWQWLAAAEQTYCCSDSVQSDAVS
jgi:hypothetical protein